MGLQSSPRIIFRVRKVQLTFPQTMSIQTAMFVLFFKTVIKKNNKEMNFFKRKSDNPIPHHLSVQLHFFFF